MKKSTGKNLTEMVSTPVSNKEETKNKLAKVLELKNTLKALGYTFEYVNVSEKVKKYFTVSFKYNSASRLAASKIIPITDGLPKSELIWILEDVIEAHNEPSANELVITSSEWRKIKKA